MRTAAARIRRQLDGVFGCAADTAGAGFTERLACAAADARFAVADSDRIPAIRRKQG